MSSTLRYLKARSEYKTSVIQAATWLITAAIFVSFNSIPARAQNQNPDSTQGDEIFINGFEATQFETTQLPFFWGGSVYYDVLNGQLGPLPTQAIFQQSAMPQSPNGPATVTFEKILSGPAAGTEIFNFNGLGQSTLKIRLNANGKLEYLCNDVVEQSLTSDISEGISHER